VEWWYAANVVRNAEQQSEILAVSYEKLRHVQFELISEKVITSISLELLVTKLA
jgi:hypothetical protein